MWNPSVIFVCRVRLAIRPPSVAVVDKSGDTAAVLAVDLKRAGDKPTWQAADVYRRLFPAGAALITVAGCWSCCHRPKKTHTGCS
jgi:hypothetical protein